MEQFLQAVVVAVIAAGLSGAISAIAVIAAVKTDIAWIKLIIQNHDTRLVKLETKNL